MIHCFLLYRSHHIQTCYFSHHKKPSLDSTPCQLPRVCVPLQQVFVKVTYASVCFLPFSVKPIPLVGLIYVFQPITPLKSLLSVIFDLYLSPGGIDHCLLQVTARTPHSPAFSPASLGSPSQFPSLVLLLFPTS